MPIAGWNTGANADAATRFSRLTDRWVRAAGATGEWLPAARASERGPEAKLDQHAQVRALIVLAENDAAAGPRRRHTFAIRVRGGGRGAQLLFASRCAARAAEAACATRVLQAASPQVTTSSSAGRQAATRDDRFDHLPSPPPPPDNLAQPRKRGRRGGKRHHGASRNAGASPEASGAAAASTGPVNAQGQSLVKGPAERARDRSRERAKRARRAAAGR